MENELKKVTIYTDGSSLKNPGRGGYGAILIYNGIEKRISGNQPNTTNNRMELTAVIEALKCLKQRCEVEIYSDSAYVVNAFELDWISNWKSNQWKKSKNEFILNVDLWKELDALVSFHKVKFNKVKGHSDNEYNNLCDILAREKASELPEDDI